MKYINRKTYLRIIALILFIAVFLMLIITNLNLYYYKEEENGNLQNKIIQNDVILYNYKEEESSSFHNKIFENDLLLSSVEMHAINYTEDNTTAEQTFNEFKKCRIQHEKNHLSVFLIKSYKAASSTLANILYRYGMQRGLTFVEPMNFKINQIFPYSINDARSYNFPIIPSCTGEYNLCTVHSRYPWKAQLSPKMPSDTFVLASVRHPATQLLSSFNYLRFGHYIKKKGIGFEKFIRAPLLYSRQYLNFPKAFYMTKKPHNLLFWNQQSQVFGLSNYAIPPGYGRKEILADKQVMREVSRFLARVEEEVDFMVIAENFTESIVMLKYAWNLKWSDVIHLKINKAANSTGLNKMNSSDVNAIIEWNYIDYLLYTRATERFRQLKNNLRYDLKQEMTKLKTMTGYVLDYCMTRDVYNTVKGQYTRIKLATLRKVGKTNLCCSMLATQEWDLNKILKKYMKSKKPCESKSININDVSLKKILKHK